MADEVKMWNGGTTNKIERQIRKWNKLLRASEDFYDFVDSEKEFRKDLQERERLMKEQNDKNPNRSTFGTFNPREQINKMMNEPAKISGGEPRNRYRRPEGSEVGNKFQGKRNND